MKKKIDPLMILTVLVVSGVILSHFVVFSQAQPSLLKFNSVAERAVSEQNKKYSSAERTNPQWQQGRQLVQIDPSGQRIH